MLKFSARKNLIYYILLIVSIFVRKIILIITDSFYPHTTAVFYPILMFVGEMLAGIILYKYQKYVTKKRLIKERLSIILSKKLKKSRIDKNGKIYFLLAMAGFFDYIEMYISCLYIPRLSYISKSLEDRLCGSLIIFSSLIYHYILKFSLLKHQKCSLIVVGICLFIIMSAEGLFEKDKINMSIFKYILLIVLSYLEMFFISMMDSIDKYLMEYDSFNPCLIIVFEGLFGTIYSAISFFTKDIQIKMQLVIKVAKIQTLGLFIFLLFLIMVLSGIVNIYRVHTNKIYNPMTESLAYYCLNPLFMIYDFAAGNDFINFGKRNYFHFFLNLFLGIVISVTGFVFNEFIVLFWCGLERDTYREISRRSTLDEKELELASIISEDEKDEKDDKDENDEDKKDKENTVTIYV